ncbi:MAG: succinate dehydrogenase assembly factor 2 [Aestuariivirgaceae bacterium]
MPDNDNTQDARKKKAIWRAEHRGIREMDLLMGGFARENVPAMDEAALCEFEALIEVSDLELYDWLLGRAEPPAEHRTGTYERLHSFRFDRQIYDG